MPRQLTIKNLALGVDSDEDRATQGFLAAIVGVDIHGVGGGSSTTSPHRVKVWQPAQAMTAETEAAGPNDITDLIEWVMPFNGRNYSLSNGSRLYESSTALGGTWTLEFATSSSTGGGGLMPFGNNLYYGQNAVLGQYDGTNSNHNFKTLSASSAGPRPMAVIGGRLAVGNQRFIGTLDSDESTFTAAKLTLPFGYVVRSVELWNNFLAIAADFTPPSATNPISSRLFLWDGTSSTYTEALELPFTSAPLLVNHDNVLWIIGGDATSNMIVLAYNGAQLKQAFFVPDVVPHGIGSKAKFQGGFLFGTNGRTNSNNGGVWMLNGGKEGSPYALSMPFYLSPNSITGTNAAGLYAEANDVLAAWYDGTNYGIDKSANGTFKTSSYIQTLPFYFKDPTRDKIFYAVRVDLRDPGTSTGATFRIRYRVDPATPASAWTTLKTIAQTDADITLTLPIKRRGKRLEVEFLWVVSGTNNPLQLRSFTLFYDFANAI